MKKLVYISFFMLLLASCQKEEIIPNTTSIKPSETEKGTDGGGSNTGEIIVSTGGTTTEGTDNGNGGVDSGGDITDPMRKKDKKDNK